MELLKVPAAVIVVEFGGLVPICFVFYNDHVAVDSLGAATATKVGCIALAPFELQNYLA